MSSTARPAERRVVITGVGLVSPLGSTPGELWEALSSGRSGVRRRPGAVEPLVAADAPQFSGAIEDFGPVEGDLKKSIRKGLKVMCRETQMAVAAAQRALFDSGALATLDPERFGVVLGSDYMLTLPEDYADAIRKCADGGAFDYSRWGSDGLREMQPLWMLKYLPNMPASHIAIYNDLRGPNNSLTMREASGLVAIGEATRIIARGGADRMVAGATGTRVLPMQAIHAMQSGPVTHDGDPATASRPFDRDRRGMVCGEGAGMVVLESLESATARGARVYGELRGFASSVVADCNLRGDTRRAIAQAARGAMADARLEASALGHVAAHGLGTIDDDAAEAAGLVDALGQASKHVPVVALKSYFGNLGGGSGVVELIGSLLALAHGALPRTLNYQTPDPACPLNVTRDEGGRAGDSSLVVSTTPQGQAAAVCVGRRA
ncbi:MAG: beta-ketoacyl-[acyl-carrier-protein] synthase family protein [Lacipirellulaceae bacterium]